MTYISIKTEKLVATTPETDALNAESSLIGQAIHTSEIYVEYGSLRLNWRRATTSETAGSKTRTGIRYYGDHSRIVLWIKSTSVCLSSSLARHCSTLGSTTRATSYTLRVTYSVS